jgi:hypothetical protein
MPDVFLTGLNLQEYILRDGQYPGFSDNKPNKVVPLWRDRAEKDSQS